MATNGHNVADSGPALPAASIRRVVRSGRTGFPCTVLALIIYLAACAPQEQDAALSAASHAAHLEEALGGARIEASAPSLTTLRNREWRFWEEVEGAGATDGADVVDGAAGSTADPATEWHPLGLPFPGGAAASVLSRTPDSLRLAVHPVAGSPIPIAIGGLYVALGGLDANDWQTVRVTARTTDRFMGVIPLFSVADGAISPAGLQALPPPPEMPPVFNDGSEHTYVFPVEAEGAGGAWSELALMFVSPEAGAEIDILSIDLVPVGADHPEAYGTSVETRGDDVRRTLYAHTPARIAYDIEVPDGGRLDLGLGVARSDIPVAFRVGIDDGGEETWLLDEQVGDAGVWAQRSVDLSTFAGRTVTLMLDAGSDADGTLAFWAAPILSGATAEAAATAPNIIFYVIDGGGADFMSVYGYNRRTTPFMEQLADEGVVFERAFTNSTWTQPSTASFMTSLQHSVLGGLNRGLPRRRSRRRPPPWPSTCMPAATRRRRSPPTPTPAA